MEESFWKEVLDLSFDRLLMMMMMIFILAFRGGFFQVRSDTSTTNTKTQNLSTSITAYLAKESGGLGDQARKITHSIQNRPKPQSGIEWCPEYWHGDTVL